MGGRWRRLGRGLGALAAVVLGAGALAACQGPNTDAVPTTVVAPPPGCDTGRVTVIGASLDLSGPGAALGHQYLTGLEMGIAKVNAGNGVPPRNSCFELEYKDNRGNPAIDTQAMLDLVNVEKAGVVVGTFLAASTASYLGSLGVTAISLSNQAITFEPTTYPYTFPMTASMPSEAFVMAKELKKARVRRVAVVVTADVASREGAAHLGALSSSDGFRIVGRASVGPSGAGAAGALAALRASRPEALVVLDDSGAVASVLAARQAMGWRVPVLAGPDATTTAVAGRLGAATRGISVVVPSGAVVKAGLGSGSTLSFRARLLARLHTGSLRGSIIPYAETYDAMTMLGSAANGSMGVVASDVQSFLQNANYQGVLASYTYTSGAHTGVSAANQVVVPLASLSNGVLRAPTSTHPSGAGG